jgi:hypothetical protein
MAATAVAHYVSLKTLTVLEFVMQLAEEMMLELEI